MPDLILHHYPASPFAEKIRLILGLKKLAWKEVIIPMVMPKPDVLALTGGYRKTPLLQIGADIYCDTALIARTLDRVAPEPDLHPAAQAASTMVLAQWADSVLFQMVMPVLYQPGSAEKLFSQFTPEQLKTFMEDRAAMRKNSTVRRPPLAEAKPALIRLLTALEAQLDDGRAWLLGAAPTIADFSVFHPLWFFRRGPAVAPMLDPYPKVKAWMARIDAIGHGKPSAITSADAITVAHDAKPAQIAAAAIEDLEGFALGDTVEVLPVDYGFDAVRGSLVNGSREEIAVRRTDDRAGEVVVHFPRQGYEVRKPAP
jgi:glutathione S-transferase